jgi:hypothetical protein
MTLMARGRTYLGVLSVSRPVVLLTELLLGTMCSLLDDMLLALLRERAKRCQVPLLLVLLAAAGCILAASRVQQSTRVNMQCFEGCVMYNNERA